MTKDLLVRGFDDKTHGELSELAIQKGVSINSIVKDAVDKWLRQQSNSPMKHHLILYDNDDSMLGLLKSVDVLAKDAGWFRCCAGPPSRMTKALAGMDWFDGTILPYKPDHQNIAKYCRTTMGGIVKNAHNKDLCCMDFLINDVARSSMKQAIHLERAYDESRFQGFMFCTYRTETLLEGKINDIMELFQLHDQVFVLRDSDVYKLHITKESMHKFFMS